MKPLTSLLCGLFLFGLTVTAQQPEGATPQQPPATPTPTPTPGNEQPGATPRVKFIDLPNLTEKSAATTNNGWVMIEGAAYLVFGDTLVPLPGGGASGCLDKDASATAARLARARGLRAAIEERLNRADATTLASLYLPSAICDNPRAASPRLAR